MVVIAGASRSGKTTLINRIKTGQASELMHRAGLVGLEPYQSHSLLQLQRLDTPPPTNLILHYDLCFQWEQNRFTALMTLAQRSKDLTIITLQTPIHVLCRRNQSRMYQQLKETLKCPWERKAWKHLGYLLRLHRLYQNPDQLRQLHCNWADGLATLPQARVWWLDTTSQTLEKRSFA